MILRFPDSLVILSLPYSLEFRIFWEGICFRIVYIPYNAQCLWQKLPVSTMIPGNVTITIHQPYQFACNSIAVFFKCCSVQLRLPPRMRRRLTYQFWRMPVTLSLLQSQEIIPISSTPFNANASLPAQAPLPWWDLRRLWRGPCTLRKMSERVEYFYILTPGTWKLNRCILLEGFMRRPGRQWDVGHSTFIR